MEDLPAGSRNGANTIPTAGCIMLVERSIKRDMPAITLHMEKQPLSALLYLQVLPIR
ncbi:hypothetical protein AB2E71_01690 (plasmid) [Escherichia coli]